MRQKGIILFLFILISCGVFTLGERTVILKKKSYLFPELKFFPKIPQNSQNPVTMDGRELGRHLFYDPVLSADSSFSCASCHQQQFAFADSARFSLGISKDAMTRNTMPLFNLAWYEAFFWDGRAVSVEEQVFEPVRKHEEMNLDWQLAEKRLNRSDFYRKKFKDVFGIKIIDSIHVAKAIAQFERTIVSYRSKFDRVLQGEKVLSPDEYEGFVLMNDQTKGNCLHCHTTDADALGTTGKFSNNGLDKISLDLGRGKISGKTGLNGHFKIPSLRNLGFTAPYMHDGRFKTLEEVLDFYSEGVQNSSTIDPKMEFHLKKSQKLTADEKRKIILFLHTLNDSILVKDTHFSSHF